MWKKLLGAGVVSAALLFIQACGLNFEPQESCNFVQNSQLQRISWKDQNPVHLFVHQSVPVEYYQAISSAAKFWNSAIGKDLLVIEGWGTSGSGPSRDNYSVIYLKKTWDPEKPTEQARTTVYWVGNQLRETDVMLNGKNFEFATTDSVSTYQVHLESLIVHEFGHVLGLTHIHDSQSVMQKILPKGANRVKSGVSPIVDRDSLRCEY